MDLLLAKNKFLSGEKLIANVIFLQYDISLVPSKFTLVANIVFAQEVFL